jgi:glycine/serine hydroxymethyltransferase
MMDEAHMDAATMKPKVLMGPSALSRPFSWATTSPSAPSDAAAMMADMMLLSSTP